MNSSTRHLLNIAVTLLLGVTLIWGSVRGIQWLAGPPDWGGFEQPSATRLANKAMINKYHVQSTRFVLVRVRKAHLLAQRVWKFHFYNPHMRDHVCTYVWHIDEWAKHNDQSIVGPC